MEAVAASASAGLSERARTIVERIAASVRFLAVRAAATCWGVLYCILLCCAVRDWIGLYRRVAAWTVGSWRCTLRCELQACAALFCAALFC